MRFQGEIWSEKAQWVIALGFTCVNKLSNVEFIGNEQTVKTLNNKLAVYAWSRDITNQTPSQLYPMKLAETTANYLSELAPKHVSYKVIVGDDLLKNGWVGYTV